MRGEEYQGYRRTRIESSGNSPPNSGVRDHWLPFERHRLVRRMTVKIEVGIMQCVFIGPDIGVILLVELRP